MLTLKFSTSSWHYKIAKFGGYSDWSSRDRNICAYLRRFILGIFKGIALGILFSIVVSTMIYGLYSAIHDLKKMTELAAIGMLVDVIVLLLGSISLFFHFKEKYGWKFGSSVTVAPSKPNFITEAYRSWKDKTCVRLEFESNENTDVKWPRT